MNRDPFVFYEDDVVFLEPIDRGGEGSGFFAEDGHKGRLGEIGGSTSNNHSKGTAKSLSYYRERIKSLGGKITSTFLSTYDFDSGQLLGVSRLDQMVNPDDYEGCTTADEYVALVEARLKEELAKNEIFVRISPANLEKVLSDGKLENTFESKSSSVKYKDRKLSLKRYQEARRNGEMDALGIPLDSTDRPVYGYFSKTENGRTLNAPFCVKNKYGDQDDPFLEVYGSIALKIKSAKRADTSWTGTDSLDSRPAYFEGFSTVKSSSPDSPSYFSFPVASMGDPLRLAWFDTDSDIYQEAQIFGGVSVNDIESVFSREPLPESVTQTLDKKGIKWQIVK